MMRAVNLLPERAKVLIPMSMHWVTADDGNGNTFSALTKHSHPEPEQHVDVWVYVDGENGWGKNVGEVAMISLKKADNGHFMS